MTQQMDFALQNGSRIDYERSREMDRIESNITSKIVSSDDIDLEISEPVFVYALKSILEWVFIIALAFGISLVINKYVVETTEVVGDSMYPYLVEGDRLLVNKIAYAFSSPKRGDVIVFDPEIDDKSFVKRVIALPGETINIKEGQVLINDVPIEETYLNGMLTYSNITPKNMPYVLGDDEYFVMGDNREVSYDSRAYEIGTITKSKIKGKLFFMVYPFDKVSALEKAKY